MNDRRNAAADDERRAAAPLPEPEAGPAAGRAVGQAHFGWPTRPGPCRSGGRPCSCAGGSTGTPPTWSRPSQPKKCRSSRPTAASTWRPWRPPWRTARLAPGTGSPRPGSAGNACSLGPGLTGRVAGMTRGALEGRRGTIRQGRLDGGHTGGGQAPNVFCKVSALVGQTGRWEPPREVGNYQPGPRRPWKLFGQDRLVFGTNRPARPGPPLWRRSSASSGATSPPRATGRRQSTRGQLEGCVQVGDEVGPGTRIEGFAAEIARPANWRRAMGPE